MGSLRRRAARLEEQHGGARTELSEHARRERWLQQQRFSLRGAMPPAVSHVRSFIAWMLMVGQMPDDPEALIERLMAAPDASGYCQPPEERSRAVVEGEVWRAVYHGEEGFEHLECPPQWAAAFEAAYEARERFLSMPPGHVANWAVERRRMQERGATPEEIEEHDRHFEEPYGLSDELAATALGPYADVLTDAERYWMLAAAPLGDVLGGSWGWQVAEQVRKLESGGK